MFTDIYPDAVKIGMVSSQELIRVIAQKLRQYGAKHIVVDPVMVATSGAKLLRDDAVEALCRELLPLAAVLTPNIPEAEILSGMTITDATGMEAAAKHISEKYGCACCARAAIRSMMPTISCGGTVPASGSTASGSTIPTPTAPAAPSPAPLPPIWPRAMIWTSPWSGPRNTSPAHWAAMLDLGHGSGPMNHMFALKGEFVGE